MILILGPHIGRCFAESKVYVVLWAIWHRKNVRQLSGPESRLCNLSQCWRSSVLCETHVSRYNLDSIEKGFIKNISLYFIIWNIFSHIILYWTMGSYSFSTFFWILENCREIVCIDPKCKNTIFKRDETISKNPHSIFGQLYLVLGTYVLLRTTNGLF